MAKRSPQDLWRALEDEARGDEELERAASLSVQDAERELAAAGFDVEAERAKAAEWRGELGRGEVDRRRLELEAEARRRALSPRPARLRLWLAAAAVAVAAGGGVLYAVTRPDAPGPPAPPPGPSAPAPIPIQAPPPDLVAADLRRRALSDCESARWAPCLAGLDRARALDPAGEDAPEVVRARALAARALSPKPR